MLLAALIGVAAAELLAHAHPQPTQCTRSLGFAAGTAFILWASWIVCTAAAAGKLPALVEMWTGIPIVGAAAAILLASLMSIPSARDGHTSS